MIYVLLPVHNRLQATVTLVNQLQQQSEQSFELILVDDGSEDGTSERVREMLGRKVTVLGGDGSLWWAGSLQRGIEHLRSRRISDDSVVLIMNNDVEIDDDFLAKGLAHVRQDDGAIYGAREYIQASGDLMCAGVEVDWNAFQFDFKPKPEQINCLSSRAIFMSWRLIRQVGGFHPILLPHYLSDYEFTNRSQKKGFRLIVPENLRIDVDMSTTGTHRLRGEMSLREFLRVMLDRRAASNPIWFSSFLLLSCPRSHLPKNLYRVWSSFFRSMKRHVSVSG